MNIVEIKPVTLWSAEGTTTANFIKFLPSQYSFNEVDISVNYQLLHGVLTPTEDEPEAMVYTYITGGAVIVPSSVVEKWVDDSEIFDYVISTLNLTKV